MKTTTKELVLFDPGQHFPIPFVVGVERSGTTLLRSMLNAHPDLALPYEGQLWEELLEEEQFTELSNPELFVERLTASIAWKDLGVDEKILTKKLKRGDSVASAMRLVYQLYAAGKGKPRAGDKTPQYVKQIGQIYRLLPDAYFIHIIRDGRAVAASLRHLWFAPTRTISGLAGYWCDLVRGGRRAGEKLPNYLEISYEALVSSPEETLKKVCNFIELPFDAAMLQYHDTALDLITETNFWKADDWSVSGKEIAEIHKSLSLPPDTSRIDAWRTVLTKEEIDRFNEKALPLLQELGYEQ